MFFVFLFVVVWCGCMEPVGDTPMIAVAMSGGVDSSVAAYLLQQQGYAVHGVFITIFAPSHIPCTASEDRQHAMRACAALGIPFLEYDATDLYRERVIEPFVAAYTRGSTPNPDVLCNTHIKFDALVSFVRSKGFSLLATGHYAQVRSIDGSACLYRSVDAGKDQTYFIHALSQEVLSMTHFPIGGYTKDAVRALASSAQLPAAQKPDSVGLCFLGAVGMKEFLSAYIAPLQGEVRSAEDGAVIGSHDGAWFYTLGQRHGFSVTHSGGVPWFVVGKDVSSNVLLVSRSTAASADAVSFELADPVFRFIPDEQLFARYRHRGSLHPVSLTVSDGEYSVVFFSPQVIAAGQSIVLYTEDGACIGGGAVCL